MTREVAAIPTTSVSPCLEADRGVAVSSTAGVFPVPADILGAQPDRIVTAPDIHARRKNSRREHRPGVLTLVALEVACRDVGLSCPTLNGRFVGSPPVGTNAVRAA